MSGAGSGECSQVAAHVHVAGYCTNMVGYGLVFGGASHLLSLLENSVVLIAGLIAIDTPRQVGWHIANARR